MPVPNSGMDILLHDHLDGSFPLLSVLPELHRLTFDDKKPYPFNQWARHQEQIKNWFLEGGVQENIVEKLSLTTGVMQNSNTLKLAAHTYVQVRARQGIKYCEIRYVPQYSTSPGLKEEEVIYALIEGIKKGEIEFPDIEVNLVISIGREISSSESIRLVHVINRMMIEFDVSTYIVGIDLVCNKPDNPPEKHLEAFKLAKKLGINRCCHVEQVKNRKPEDKDTPEKIDENFEEDLPQLIKNLRTAIFDLEINGIGCAVGLAYDPELIQAVVNKKIRVELCPGSDLITGLISNIKTLKIRELLEAGVLCSLNPNNDLFMSNIHELVQMYEDAYGKPPIGENLDLIAKEKKILRQNAWLTRFGNRKTHKI